MKILEAERLNKHIGGTILVVAILYLRAGLVGLMTKIRKYISGGKHAHP